MTKKSERARGGYVSYVMVLGMGIVLLLLLVSAYKTSIRVQETQAKAGLRIDYSEKEEAVLRAIVNLTPNRAIRAMQHQSDVNAESRAPLTWQAIFSEALDQANARQSFDAQLLTEFGLEGAKQGNAGDAAFTDINGVFGAISPEEGYVAPGIGRSLGAGFPPPLETTSGALVDKDRLYPIISAEKRYGSLADGQVGLPPAQFPGFNLLPYPEIRFGYAQPGEPFVAKRNWWAFSLDLADADGDVTGLERSGRDFVLSIYEIPSQLAISAEAFTVLGQHADGSAWQNTTIQGGVYATRAKVEEGMNLARISGRRGVEISADALVGDKTMAADPFAAGVREQFELEHKNFLPVSLASESGRAAFIPINRGEDFFDRHAHTAETQTISPTTWHDYSVGAAQCAMHLDITEVVDQNDNWPTELTFHYLKNGTRQTLEVDMKDPGAGNILPTGFNQVAVEHGADTVIFTRPTDVAYGANGKYFFQYGVTGTVKFDNNRFGDPIKTVTKFGYARAARPFGLALLHDSKPVVEFYPERLPEFLAAMDADGPEVNNSVSINVDYPGNIFLEKPSIPCTDLDYGVVLRECADLTDFTKGFSVVTNLRLYIGDDFNTVNTTPPAGSRIPSPYFPPCSLFAPEKRYGAEMDPLALQLSGQMGSLAGDEGDSVHLLDLKMASESEIAHNKVEVNLSPITHPAALPPITMMNWLVVIEERRKEFYTGTQASN